jgi:hypothetical protein
MLSITAAGGQRICAWYANFFGKPGKAERMVIAPLWHFNFATAGRVPRQWAWRSWCHRKRGNDFQKSGLNAEQLVGEASRNDDGLAGAEFLGALPGMQFDGAAHADHDFFAFVQMRWCGAAESHLLLPNRDIVQPAWLPARVTCSIPGIVVGISEWFVSISALLVVNSSILIIEFDSIRGSGQDAINWGL